MVQSRLALTQQRQQSQQSQQNQIVSESKFDTPPIKTITAINQQNGTSSGSVSER
jgi:hypothetical protein